MKIRIFRVQGDCKLIIKHVNEEFVLKEIVLVPYQTTMQMLIKSFAHISSSICRKRITRTDALATLAS